MLVRLNHIYAIDPTLEELGKEDLMMVATQEEAWLDPLNLYIETTGEKYKLLKSLSVPPSLACNFIAIYRYGKLSELLLIKMRSFLFRRANLPLHSQSVEALLSTSVNFRSSCGITAQHKRLCPGLVIVQTSCNLTDFTHHRRGSLKPQFLVMQPDTRFSMNT